MTHSVRKNLAWRKLARGETVFGPNLQIPSPELVELFGLAGFDFVMLDGEHGATTPHLPSLILACDAAGVTSIVRVPSHDRGWVLPAMELGAGGIQVPMVETEAQARALVHEAKYPPLGGRGLSTVPRAARYSFTDPQRYRQAANREVLLIVQIETRRGVENAEAIARVPGVDLVFIGPADLAQSYGHAPGPVPEETATVIDDLIVRLAPIKPISVPALTSAEVARWHRLGVRSFLTSSIIPLRDAFLGLHAMLRAGLAPPVKTGRARRR
ncbi:MAG: hypothetical protein EXS37_04795 [Opitutus sp.]|nr:hypothetical protein [Opitutus sp.]